MIEFEDRQYLMHREATQRRLAARALDPAIAAIHTQMADEYAARIPRGPAPALRLVI